jgi:hypothetical protein
MILRRKNGEVYTFPGGFKGNPYAWDAYRNESWQTRIPAPGSHLQLFHPETDRSRLVLYNPDWRNISIAYPAAGKNGDLVWKASLNKSTPGTMLGLQTYLGNALAARQKELGEFSKLVVSVRASEDASAKLTLITTVANAFGTTFDMGTEWREVEIPLTSLQRGDFLLLPRPYPGFQPLLFQSVGEGAFRLADTERLELRFAAPGTASFEVELGSVWLVR